MGRLPTKSNSWEPVKNLANAPDLIAQYCQCTGLPRREGEATIRNIPDNTGVQKDVLCTLQYKEQDKKGSSSPLLGKLLREARGLSQELKMKFLIQTGFIPQPRAWWLAHARPPPATQPPPTRLLPPASQPPPACLPAKWGNCQKGKPKKAISPNPNGGGTVAQIWNLPNLEGVDKQSSITNNASTAKAELKCITVPENAPILFHAKPPPFPSQKGIPDNTKCLGSPVQCFVLFMPH
ncbi:hypothetical protein DSO57_1017872 [Entomophthora muscae]|uniref:Uncharacterized protein n=1 Tax=Entomophthora muscae TaxID=34485 RepID=A0ACC2TFE0_9FUNG|nr:hypothetical protein DSO57_1017872 [Entomophthora muscae]